jgi:sulfoxide reductase heme-binding subunit YedZ
MARTGDLAWLPPAVYLGGLAPGAILFLRGLRGELGPNPISEGMNGCGELAVKLLILSLACTPARILFGVTWPLRIRKALGLLAYTYGVAHLSVYLLLDQRGSDTSIVDDVVKRPFIAIGMITLALLTPLALTSTNRARKWLGAKRWQRLHKLVYVAATLAIVHFTMKQKESVVVPLAHGAVLAALFVIEAKRRDAQIECSCTVPPSIVVATSMDGGDLRVTWRRSPS